MSNPSDMKPLSAAASLLLQAAGTSRDYFSEKEKMVEASIGLFHALIEGGQLDLKVPVQDGSQSPGLPLPAAWTYIQNPMVERVASWVSLDPDCLSVETVEGPSFRVAVVNSLKRVAPTDRGIRSSGVYDEDAALAEWCRHVPLKHCLSFDVPGDDPGSGLLDLLRRHGHFKQLENELAKKGIDLDGCMASGRPTSVRIHSDNQWDDWLVSGGDPTKKVPPAKSRPEMTVWEYHALARPSVLLPSIRKWAENGEPRSKEFLDRLDHLEFWHAIDVEARDKSRDELVATLKEMEGWKDRVDDMGRNVLMRVVLSQPAFLTTCIKTVSNKSQLSHIDHEGRGIWHYALPALLNYNRSTDAKNIAKELAKVAHPSRQSIDGDRARGLLISELYRVADEISNPPPKKNASYRAAPIVANFNKLVNLKIDALVGASVEDQRTAIRLMLSDIDPEKPAVLGSYQPLLEQLAQSVDHFGFQADDLLPEFRATLAYLSMLPVRHHQGNSFSNKVAANESMIKYIDRWLSEGMLLPDYIDGFDPLERFQQLRELWSNPGMVQVDFRTRDQSTSLFKVWGNFEEDAALNRRTAPAPLQTRPPPRL